MVYCVVDRTEEDRMQIGTLSLASLARLREGVRRERISSWDQGLVAAAEPYPWLR